MPLDTFEIRSCDSCGLRYPLPFDGQPASTRCPACKGTTRLILRRNLTAEPTQDTSIPAPRNDRYAVLLDNIRSAWNVGSILRSADGFGFTDAYLCGITPTPDHDAVKKTSLGAENTVTWSYHKDAVTLGKELKSQGWHIMALEEHERSSRLTDAPEINSTSPLLLIVGNETTGVDPHLLDLCNEIYHIPMHGEKRSFNVAIAFGIAAYALAG
jgi:tRNA G18 (ribose-2'-O)-methylase SpoU